MKMLVLDWVMDKLGYQKKIIYRWENLFAEFDCEKPKRKVAKKKPATKKPTSKKTVRKKV
jgi:hypothetical protein